MPGPRTRSTNSKPVSATSKAPAAQSTARTRAPSKKSTAPAPSASSSTSASSTQKTDATALKNLQAENKRLQAELKAQKEAEIRKRSAALLQLEEESGSSDPEHTPSSSRKKRKTAPSIPIDPALDNEEEAFAASLKSTGDIPTGIEGLEGDVEFIPENLNLNQQEDESEDEANQDASSPVSENLNGKRQKGSEAEGSEIEVSELDDHAPHNSRGSSRAPSATSSSQRSEKVTKNTFSPTTARLAALSKSKAREYVSTVNAFPTDKDAFIWGAIQDAAKLNKECSDTLQRVSQDLECKESLIDYAGYAIGGLRGELKAKAKASIAGHYGVPGSLSAKDIRETVRWLLTRSNFMYGGVNVSTLQVDRQEAFKHPVITDIIRAQWFGKGKADVLTFNRMIAEKKIFGPVIILVVTAVECAIKEWSEGSYHLVHFSEDTSSERYAHHLKSWENLRTRSPNWLVHLQQQLFTRIIKSANKSYVSGEDDEDDLNDIDYDKLEASVQV